jgi:hypothetical protein
MKKSRRRCTSAIVTSEIGMGTDYVDLYRSDHGTPYDR